MRVHIKYVYSRFYTSFMKVVVDSRTISATKALPDIVFIFGVYYSILGVWYGVCLMCVCGKPRPSAKLHEPLTFEQLHSVILCSITYKACRLI